MSSTIPLKATFEAFKKHERTGVLTQATIAYLLIAFIILGLFVWSNFSAFGEVAGWYVQMIQATTYGGDPSAMATPPMAMMRLIPSYFLVLFIVFALMASYEAACLRWLVRGETGGFLGLTLGADMWRVYSGYWVWYGLFIGFYLASIIVVAILAGVLSVSGDAALTGIVLTIAVLAILGAAIYFAVRLAPAAATSIAQGRFSFFKAWTATRGRFWALFGSFFLLGLLYVVGLVVIYILGAVVIGMMAGPALMQMGAGATPEQTMTALGAALASPNAIIAILIFYGLGIVLATMIYVGFFGVNARAAIVAREEGKLPS